MIQRPRLLIIDDNPIFRKLLIHSLRRHFFVVDAQDGCDGYSRAFSVPPDAVLLDMHMEGWSGLETLRKFREHPRFGQVPILMLTGDNQRETVLEAIRLGASDYVLKTSMHPAELVTRIMSILPAHLLKE